jgi:hypothetical protein
MQLLSIVETINEVLKNNDINAVISPDHITVTENLVCDFAKPDSYLSECIIQKLWPRIDQAKVFHFTSMEAAESIISSRTFRLQNLAKRFGEGELSTFSATHKLDGYMEQDAHGKPVYRTLLMPTIFYASFADSSLSGPQQEALWRRFAPNDGVRLTLNIEASNPNFRRIKYEGKQRQPIKVLEELATTLKDRHNRRFLLSGISRLCAFYLPGAEYEVENELRVLYKAWEGIGPQPIGSGASAYLEIPLGSMSEAGYRIDIVEVCSRTRPSMPDQVQFSPRT